MEARRDGLLLSSPKVRGRKGFAKFSLGSFTIYCVVLFTTKQVSSFLVNLSFPPRIDDSFALRCITGLRGEVCDPKRQS